MKRALPKLLQVCVLGAAALALTGCPPEQKTPTKQRGSISSKPAPGGSAAVFANQLAGPNLARIRVVQLDVYHLRIPLGAISRSEEFWKHVDEQRVDVGTYDLLRKNGWRVGIAPTAEWNYFRDIIEAYPASSKPMVLSVGPTGADNTLELPMKEKIAYENIFYFDDQNTLFGRTFERCDNIVNITLQQAPRKPGDARVALCPVVRSMRARYEVTKNGQDREIRFVHPEQLYDLNMQVDVPMGQFLVIAPSPEVKWKTSLGATFLIDNGVAEQFEQVLLLVPRAAELEETIPAAAPAAKSAPPPAAKK